MKWISILGVTTAVGFGVLFWQGFDPLRQGPRPGDERAQRRADPRGATIFASGFVEGRGRETKLNFEIAGRLAAVHVQEGKRIQKGAILARLDDTILRHRLAEAKSRRRLAHAERKRLVNGASLETRRRVRALLESASIRVKHAKADFERALAAYKKNAISVQRYDDYRYRFDVAQSEWEQASARVAETEAKVRADDLAISDAKVGLAEVEVARAQTMLQKSVLRAPESGIVLRVDVEPGEWVGSAQIDRARPDFVLVDDSIIRVRGYVEESEVLSVRVGQRADITADGLPNVRFAGTIAWIAPSMQNKRQRHHKPGERIDVRVREVLIRIDAPGDLVIGLPVEVFIKRNRRKPTAVASGRNAKPGFSTKVSAGKSRWKARERR